LYTTKALPLSMSLDLIDYQNQREYFLDVIEEETPK